MAQPPGQKRAATNDIYTFFLILAAMLLLLGTIYIAWRSIDFYGSVFPGSGA